MQHFSLRSSKQSLPKSLTIDKCISPGNPWLKIAVLLFQATALGACSSTIVSTPHMATPDPVAATPKTTPHTSPVRVMVKFAKPVPYKDTAFLNTMAQQIQAPVVYLSSISTDTHVYLLNLQPAQKPADILLRLSAMSAVLRVEVDSLAKTN